MLRLRDGPVARLAPTQSHRYKYSSRLPIVVANQVHLYRVYGSCALPTVAPVSGILGVFPETGGFIGRAGFQVDSRVEKKL